MTVLVSICLSPATAGGGGLVASALLAAVEVVVIVVLPVSFFASSCQRMNLSGSSRMRRAKGWHKHRQGEMES